MKLFELLAYRGAKAAPLSSPALTDSPTTPTAPANSNSTLIASTAYADRAAGADRTNITTGITGMTVTSGAIAKIHWDAPAAARTDGILAAVDGSDHTGANVITTGITQPDYPRNITVTAGGTESDIKEIQVTVTGTDYNDEVITETLGSFTVDTEGTTLGIKAFKTITSISIPAHDGVGATTSVGYGKKLGLPCGSALALACTVGEENYKMPYDNEEFNGYNVDGGLSIEDYHLGIWGDFVPDGSANYNLYLIV